MAGSIRGILGLTSLVLIGGSIVLILFVVLGGVTSTTPLDKTYFLSADTSSIQGARHPTSQWNYFYVCGGGNSDCGSAVPALPFGYAWVGNSAGAPSALVGSHGKNTTSHYYYYVWRFGWVFYLMGLVFDVLGFFTALLAPFSRLASAFSGLIITAALIFFGLGASLMTAEFVKARNRFRDAGMSASIGRYAFGFTWAAWFALFLASILLFCGCAFGRSSDNTTTTRSTGGSTRFFRSQRSRRSTRGSFVNGESESQQRVKEEY